MEGEIYSDEIYSETVSVLTRRPSLRWRPLWWNPTTPSSPLTPPSSTPTAPSWWTTKPSTTSAGGIWTSSAPLTPTSTDSSARSCPPSPPPSGDYYLLENLNSMKVWTNLCRVIRVRPYIEMACFLITGSKGYRYD